jgi:hypothetical protein
VRNAGANSPQKLVRCSSGSPCHEPFVAAQGEECPHPVWSDWRRTRQGWGGIGSRSTLVIIEDIRFGFGLAKEIARLEIGQTVVVKEGTTLAVEGFEGTDACLERGGKLAGKSGGAVAVKLARAGHDLRFDIPCIGPKTVEICSQNGIRVLAFEAGMTLLIDREELEEKARIASVSLVSATF